MKVLLVSTYDSTEPAPTLPLALAHIKPYLEKEGIETEIIDVFFEDDREVLVNKKLKSFCPDVVGLSIKYQDFEGSRLGTNQYEMVINLTNYIKESSNATILLGGAGFSGAAEHFLKISGVKYGIIGEGERSLVKFVKAIEQGTDPASSNIGGLICNKGNGQFDYHPTSEYEDITGYPLPERSLFDNRYTQVKGFIPINGIQTCRGCSKKCIMCNIKYSEGNLERIDSPAKVVAQIQKDQERGFKGFYLADTIFNRPIAHAHEICDAFIKSDIKGPWSTTCVPTDLSMELLKKMKTTGCNLITLGIDTGDENLLKKWKKGFTIDSIIKAVENCKKVGMISIVTLCIGGPGENLETLKNTFEVIDSINPDILLTYYGFRIYRGTELAEIAKEKGYFKNEEELFEKATYYESPDLPADEFLKWYKNRYADLSRVNVMQKGREAISWYRDRANEIAKVIFNK
jgi:anaerobic magnesium-protoporphyrin IX monomethyl ester cyclase